ncbi:MAG: FG-GAP-like repeat-containing protein [Bacteroidota bacterium]
MKLKLLLLFFGVLTLNLQAQDSCDDALSINDGIHTVQQIDGEILEFLTVCPPNFFFGSRAEWYLITTDQDTTVTITTELPQNVGQDTRVSIYSGECGMFTLLCITANEDNGISNLSTAEFQAQAGMEYYIMFDNYWASTGFDFEVTFSEPLEYAVSFTGEAVSCNGCGRIVVDMDGDHLDDLVGISNPVQVLKQLPGGGFSSTSVVVPDPDHPASWSTCAGDLDNNGYTDLVYAGGGGATIMMANEDGSAYTEVSPEIFIFSQRSNVIDINNDGLLDVFVCHDVDANVFFINDGMGGFTTNQGGLGNTGGNYGSIWSDMDNDGDLDMIIAKCGFNNINEYHVNNGDGTYSELGNLYNMDDPTQTWSVAVGDYDNDGDMDVVVGASSGTHRVLRNDITTFVDVTAGSGFDLFFGTDIEWVTKDFNNDGFLDVRGAGNFMIGNGDFTWTLNPTTLTNGPIGDLNHDGFLDIVNGNTIFYNEGNDNNWIKVHPVGTVSNIDGIGARIKITTPSGMQIRDIRSGEGFGQMNSLTANFGIGEDTQVSEVTVYWPSGIVNTIKNPEINQGLVVVEEETSTSVFENDVNSSFNVFPNPVTAETLTLSSSEDLIGSNCIIYNSDGKEELSLKLTNDSINVSQMAAGVYTLIIELKDGTMLRKQFIKAE